MDYLICLTGAVVVLTWVLIVALLDLYRAVKRGFLWIAKQVRTFDRNARAKRDQAIREMYWRIGFQNAIECLYATKWATVKELEANMKARRETRYPC